MSKIKLTGSNSGYVEIDSAADAGNLTLSLPTSGTRLLSNTDNVFSGITTTAELDINGKIDVSTDIVGGRNLKVTGITTLSDDVTFTGASYNVLWDKSDNQLEFGDSAKLSFGASSDLQLYHDGSSSYIDHGGIGNLFIRGNNTNAISLRAVQGENSLICHANAQVQLYYNNSLKFETTNTGAKITGICTATSFSGSGEGLTRTTQLSHRNIVINGAMLVAQRGTSSTISGYGSVDRFNVINTGTDESPTQAQVDVASGTTPFTLGFRKALKVTNGNQTGGAGTLDFITMRTRIEAQDMANSGWNYTSSSSFITLSFWAKSSVAQNFYGYLYTHDGTAQAYAFETGSLTANTWTKVVLKIPGNSNLQFDNNANEGLDIYISQFWGTDRTDGGKTLNSWLQYNGSARTRDFTSTWYTTNDATFELTGVQLEVGEQATPFEHRSFHDELLRCYRYYNKKNPCYGRIGHMYTNSAIAFTMDLPCEMRASPTISNEGGLYFARQNGLALGLTGINHGSTSTATARISLDVNSNGDNGESAFIWSNSTYYILDAEI